MATLQLNLDGKLKSLNGVEKLTNLETLEICNDYIEDLTPLKDLKKLTNLRIKTADSDANINILKALNLTELDLYQDMEKVYVDKGKVTEIDSPSILQKMKDSNNILYCENISFESENVTFNDDKTKIRIDATKSGLGDKYCTLYGRTYDEKRTAVRLELQYTVRENVEQKVEVNIPDQALKNDLLKNYDVDGDKKITNYDMLQIQNLSLYNYQVKDMTGIEQAKNLTSLYLSGDFENIEPVNKLTNLKNLSLNGEVVNKLLSFTILNKLNRLNLGMYSSNDDLDYKFIGALTNLTNLEINDEYRKIAIDINDLSKLTNLTYFSIRTQAQMNNIEALTKLSALSSLSIHTVNNLENIDFLSNMPNIENLDLSDNNISDITPLRTLTKLRNLDILKNPINTKESETAETLKILRDNGTYISVIETNSTSNIEFKDERFKQILIKNNNADLNKDNQISVEEMERLSYIYLSGNDSITSIDEIVYATNAIGVYVSQEVEDISPLAKLPRLRTLSLSNKSATDKNLLTAGKLTKLTSIEVSVYDYNTTFTNLKMLEGLTSLQTLRINTQMNGPDGKPRIFDLNGIEKLTELTTVSMNGCITNFALLKKLPKLKELRISDEVYNSGVKLTEKEVMNFISELNIDKIYLNANSTKNIDLGIKLLNSTQKVDLKDIGSEFLKSALTEGGLLYGENLTVSYYQNGTQIKENPITLDTKELGEKSIWVSVRNDKFNISINLRWKNYITGDTSKEIAIKDAKLKKVLLDNYDIDNDKKITEQDMINLIDIDAYNCEIESLSGLEKATNLKVVYLSRNYIKDITPILNLTNIESIELSQNMLTDISCIANAKWKKLYDFYVINNFIDFTKGNANYNAISNIFKLIEDSEYKEESFRSNINSQYDDNINDIDKEVNFEKNLKAKLTKVGIDANKDGKITRRELYYAEYDEDEYYGGINLSNAEITDISGLEYLASYYINLADNNISDITPITKNKCIYGVNLSNNNISSIAGIENNKNLTELDLSNNKITDITPISKLEDLTRNVQWRRTNINLSNNQISNIDCVKDWKNLSTLDLSGNKITSIKELKNYNFKLWDNMTEEEVNESAQYLTIDLSENKIDMTNADNKQAKKVFDDRGAILKLIDKSKTTEYVMNKDGKFTADSNLGIINTALTIRDCMYEFVEEKDKKYYPEGSTAGLKGIFVNTKYYDSDPAQAERLKEKKYGVEAVITGAIKTERALNGSENIVFTLKLPEEYVGGEAALHNSEGTITKRTRNTIDVQLPLKSYENDNCYYTVYASIYLKAKEYKVNDINNNDEIINAINNEQNVTLDMKKEVKEVSTNVFENLAKKEDVDLKVQTAKATWKFNSSDINNTNISLNPTVTISNNKFENMDKPPFEDAIYLKFDHEGALPGKATIELDVSENNKYEKGKTVYLYYFDSTKNKYQYISAVTADDKKITIELEHCSEYVISDKLITTLGDVDGDGSITAKDAVMVLKYVAHNIELTDEQLAAADTTKDGKVDAKDAVQILKYVAHNITEF